jgi:hypothetical protein
VRGREVAVACAVLVSGCVSSRIDRVPADVLRQMDRVCIVRNPKVIVPDFLSVVQDAFRRHGIQTAVYDSSPPADCTFLLDYTARQGWDGVNYLKFAQLTLREGSSTIGAVEYRHGGGFDFSKFAGTYSKISPLVDELLSASPARQ